MSGAGTSGPVEAVLVVVPAHDEEALLPACLAGLRRSTDRLAAVRPEIAVSVVVVLDGCTDGSAGVVHDAGLTAIETPRVGVGRARAAGVETAARGMGNGIGNGAAHEERTWLACTDADSVVPEHWLLRHVELAEAGADVVVGTVRPRLADLSADRAAVWRATHVPGHANGHVHGANLGLRLSVYRAAGGFAPVAEHEDVALVAAARRTGARLVPDAACEVLTSARLVGRTPGGYARHLREDLVADPELSAL
ncbi:glycosyltransferase [Cellulosimicrobium marinum]|uniref:glycosyltransferase n=1 Tax=Cellulosimicrobium marinum TaxID=1638992 RepID=UPI001E6025D9|nr:glycosyltransferase [Cellulosimicrobium marinum]MCB7135548.1 glycosyltransferase [Cellulosimicrobium marinum]